MAKRHDRRRKASQVGNSRGIFSTRESIKKQEVSDIRTGRTRVAPPNREKKGGRNSVKMYEAEQRLQPCPS